MLKKAIKKTGKLAEKILSWLIPIAEKFELPLVCFVWAGFGYELGCLMLKPNLMVAVMAGVQLYMCVSITKSYKNGWDTNNEKEKKRLVIPYHPSQPKRGKGPEGLPKMENLTNVKTQFDLFIKTRKN